MLPRFSRSFDAGVVNCGRQGRVEENIERLQSDTFVVKVVAGDGATLIGQIQHLLTGEKYGFHGLEELGRAITRMKRRHGGVGA